MNQKISKKTGIPLPTQSRNTPATAGFVWDLHQESKNDTVSLRLAIDAKFDGIDAKFSGLDAKFSDINAQFSVLRSEIAHMNAEICRTKALSEEQNARNLAVLDGYQQIYDRQKRINDRVKRIEKRTFGIAEPDLD